MVGENRGKAGKLLGEANGGKPGRLNRREKKSHEGRIVLDLEKRNWGMTKEGRASGPTGRSTPTTPNASHERKQKRGGGGKERMGKAETPHRKVRQTEEEEIDAGHGKRRQQSP